MNPPVEKEVNDAPDMMTTGGVSGSENDDSPDNGDASASDNPAVPAQNPSSDAGLVGTSDGDGDADATENSGGASAGNSDITGPQGTTQPKD